MWFFVKFGLNIVSRREDTDVRSFRYGFSIILRVFLFRVIVREEVRLL